MKKQILTLVTAIILLTVNTANAEVINDNKSTPIILQSVINTLETSEINKSSIFDASQSFIPENNKETTYKWDFGDGNKNEGVEVLHTYHDSGTYTVTLTIENEGMKSTVKKEIFAYKQMFILLTDQEKAKERIEIFKNIAQENGTYIETIESFGSSTEFISEEVLTKKMNEKAEIFTKTNNIIIWTKENAGLNAISRFIRGKEENSKNVFTKKNIYIIEDNIKGNIARSQRQYGLIQPKNIVITKEGAINEIIKEGNKKKVIENFEKGGYEYVIINEKTGKIKPWKFMTYFVNILTDNGIPDNTIALLLLLPVIATTVAFMKQVVGVTTFGIYTPSIITLSFLVIGIQAGLLTLTVAIGAGALMRPLLKKTRMLFIPKMAMVITVVSLTLLFLLIISIKLKLFNTQFLSIAIFPMLILSTLVEKFVSVKTNKGLSSALALMLSTVVVAITAYLIVGGEIDLGIIDFKFELVKTIVMSYPETVILLLIIDFMLGRWNGLRIMETIRFKEILRHIEE